MLWGLHATRSTATTTPRPKQSHPEVAGSSWELWTQHALCGHRILSGDTEAQVSTHAHSPQTLSESLSQNHFQPGLTLSRSAPGEAAGVLPLSSRKHGTSPIFWGRGGVSEWTEFPVLRFFERIFLDATTNVSLVATKQMNTQQRNQVRKVTTSKDFSEN